MFLSQATRGLTSNDYLAGLVAGAMLIPQINPASTPMVSMLGGVALLMLLNYAVQEHAVRDVSDMFSYRPRDKQ